MFKRQVVNKMNFGPKRGFVLLDVLFGLGLFVAVALVCGYSRLFVQNFASTSMKIRQFAYGYYCSRPAGLQESVKVTFEFLQGGVHVARYDDELVVLRDKELVEYPLVRKEVGSDTSLR